jgi:hypothetical protein
MPTYQVHIVQMVSTTIDVEAETPEQATEVFLDAPDAPGSLVHGAFGGGASVDEAGDWEAYAVMLGNDTVWERKG